jgi:hypothetical protein
VTRAKRAVLVAVYAAWLLVFAISVASFYRSGTGFTSFILFGKTFAARALPEVRAIPHFDVNGPGYDGQFYAQLAVRPAPWDPAVYEALDNAWFRAGRILPAFIACGLSFGRADWAIHIYSMECVAAWLLLAAVLLHWFPPSSFQNALRWSGCLFCSGMMMAVCRALPDAVALLLVAAGGYYWERGSRLGPVLMGISGLAKETGLVTTVAFVDEIPRGHARWVRMAGNVGLAVAAPLLWFGTLRFLNGWVRLDNQAFAPPLLAPVARIWATVGPSFRGDWRLATLELSTLGALMVQAAFFLTRWQPKDWRWRVGAAHVPLMAILGKAVWEGYPIAAARVLLPMTLMFNLLVPPTRYGWVWLVLGNLSLISGLEILSGAP